VIASYLVAAGGFLDIDVKVSGPDNKIVYEVDREKEGSFQFIANAAGVYKFCFGNTMSTVTGKTLGFHIYVGNAISHHDAAKHEHLTPLENSITQLSEGLYRVKDSLDYHKYRERVCRNTNESTNQRVLWWNVAETSVLVLVSGFQMWYLRRFFERKSSS